MCGRAVQSSPIAELVELFGLASVPDAIPPRYNVAPTQPIAIIRATPDGKRALSHVRWGLIPSWAKDASGGSKMINARVESLAERPAFREALEQRRCLVVIDGFYEWKAEERRTTGVIPRTPYFVHRADQAPLAVAGLWDVWRAPGGEAIESCAVVTTEALAPVNAIHDRMPLILAASELALWLDPSVRALEQLASLLRPHPSPELACFAVDLRVNSPANEGPECLTPAPMERAVGNLSFDFRR